MARPPALPPPVIILVILAGLSCASGHLAEPSGLSAPVTATLLRGCEGGALLCLDDVASFPGDVVFLGGHFYGAGWGMLCSTLFVSRDGGRTWRDAGLRYVGCGIQDLRTVGASNVWGIVTFRQEGCGDPERVIRSDDAGRTWSVTPLEPCVSGITWVRRFEFDDAQHGLLSVSNGLYQTQTFTTEDGGRTWRSLWSARRNVNPEVEEGADHPPSPGRSPSAPLYEEELDHHKVAGWIRLREADESIVVEACDLKFPLRWRERSRIARRYEVTGGRLVQISSDSGSGKGDAGRAVSGLVDGTRPRRIHE